MKTAVSSEMAVFLYFQAGFKFRVFLFGVNLGGMVKKIKQRHFCIPAFYGVTYLKKRAGRGGSALNN